MATRLVEPMLSPQLAVWPTSGRDTCRDKELSEEATSLFLKSRRLKTNKSYDSLFDKWHSWCNRRYSDPFSGPVSEVVNFLAHAPFYGGVAPP